MDPQDAIRTFASSVASTEKTELEDIVHHITEFYDELAALPQIEFFAIHIRHPLLNNSRASLAIPMPSALLRTQAVLGEMLGCKGVDESLAFDFHASLLDIYFKLIGRSDSFSDSILRAVGYPDETTSRELLATFAFIDPAEQSISYEEESSFLAVAVDRNIRCRLLGWDGDTATTPDDVDCKLLPLFFKVVFKEIYEQGATADTLIERARQVLEKECFFTSREAFISSESAKLVRSGKPAVVKSRTAAEQMFGRLFKGGIADPDRNQDSHNEQVSRVAQILAMFQSVGVYAPVSSDEFAVYAFKLQDGGNPFAHGVTLGGKYLDREFLQQRRRGAQFLIQNINEKLVHRCTEGTGARRDLALQEQITFDDKHEPQRNQLQKELSLGGLNWDTFDCLIYVANHLLGKRHENNPLSFRIVTATDETLRQYFEPITAESGILSIDEMKHAEVALTPETTQSVWNTLLRVIAIIEGNYSFAQDESLYLCFSYSPQAWTLRYLARFHRRIRRQLDNVGKRPVSRVEQLEIISGLSRGALFAFLENNDTGLIALNGELVGIGNKRSIPRWKLGSREGDLRYKLTKLIEPSFSHNPAKQFQSTLYEVIEQIADSPGQGATFVIGKWKGKGNLGKRCQKMTAVFEMVAQWRLSEVDDVVLYQAAIQDGAIVIGTDTNELYCRRQLVAVDDRGVPFNPERWPLKRPLVERWADSNSEYSWPTSGNWYKWGTRHRSAASLAYVGGGSFIVVCVSSDTAVHLFDGKLVHNLRD